MAQLHAEPRLGWRRGSSWWAPRTSTSWPAVSGCRAGGDRDGRAPGARYPAERAPTRRSPPRASGRRPASSGGSATDDLVLRSLEHEGVDTSGVVRDERRERDGADPRRGRRRERDRRGARGQRPPERGGRPGRRRRRGDVPSGRSPTTRSRAAAAGAPFFCLNAAPVRGPLELEPDLLVVNRYEYEASRRSTRKLVALTLGAEGAVLLEDGQEVARAKPPRCGPSTARPPGTRSAPRWSSRSWKAGSAARRSVAPVPPERWRARRIGRAAVAADRRGARRGTRRVTPDHPRLRPRPRRRDRADARAREPRGGAARRDAPSPATRRSRRRPPTRSACSTTSAATTCRSPPAPSARSCASGTRAAHVHGETGLDGRELPPPAREPRARARDRLDRAQRSPSEASPVTLVADRAARRTSRCCSPATRSSRRGSSGSC